MYAHATAALVVAFSLALTTPSALAADETSGTLTTWIITDGGAAIGHERLRLVGRDSGALFASGELKITKGKPKVHLQTHLQRTADGALLKYRRVTAGRKGTGVMAFARNGALRLVGVNSGAKPREVAGVLARYAWDPEVWHHFAIAARVLDPGKATVELPYFDVAAGKQGTARFAKQPATTVTDPEGRIVAVDVWLLQAGPGAPLTVFVSKDAARQLVGVAAKDRRMLLKGWTWEKGAPVVDDGDDEASEAATDDDDEDEVDDIDPGAVEVGP